MFEPLTIPDQQCSVERRTASGMRGKVNEKNDPSGVGAPDGPIKSARDGGGGADLTLVRD